MKNKPVKSPLKPILITTALLVIFSIIFIILYLNYASKNSFPSNTSNLERFSDGDENSFPSKISALEQLSEAGKFVEAEKAANEILSLNPGKDIKADAVWELTISQSAQGKSKEALESAKLMQNLDLPSYHYLLGLIYIDMNDITRAKQELTQAKQSGPYLTEQIDSYLNQLN